MKRLVSVLVVGLSSCGQVSPKSSELNSSRPGRVVSAADRKFVSEQSYVFGKGYWEGFISFVATNASDCVCNAYRGCTEEGIGALDAFKRCTSEKDTKSETSILIKDSSMQTWDHYAAFKNLILPVSIAMTKSQYYAQIYTRDVELRHQADITSIVYKITKTNPIPAFTLKNKADKKILLDSKGADIPGVKLSFSASIKLFDNFAAGTDCSRVTITGADLNVVLDAEHPSASIVDTIAPVEFKASPSCQSSRLANPENKEEDFELTVSDMLLGDPV